MIVIPAQAGIQNLPFFNYRLFNMTNPTYQNAADKIIKTQKPEPPLKTMSENIVFEMLAGKTSSNLKNIVGDI